MNHRRLPLLAIAALMLSACSPSAPQGAHLGDDPFTLAGSGPQFGVDQAQSDSRMSGAEDPNAIPAAPKLRSAGGTLHLLLDEEAALPQSLLDDFTYLTGVPVEVVSLASRQDEAVVDAFIGFDASGITRAIGAEALTKAAPVDAKPTHPVSALPSAVDYARDDVCVLADAQWYALNKLQVPANLAALGEAPVAAQLTLAPSESSTAYVFTEHVNARMGGHAKQWLGKVQGQALAPKTWAEAADAFTLRIVPQANTHEVPGRSVWAGAEPGPSASSSENPGKRPLRVAPISLAARSTTNTQTSGYLTALEGSCAERYLYIAAAATVSNPDAVEAFTAYMVSPRAQRLMALSGAAAPVDPAHAVNTPIDWYASSK